MNEWQKAQAGYLYDPSHDKALREALTRCADLCFDYNRLKASDREARDLLIRQILGQVDGDINVTSPFHCDYGSNIHVGDSFYANYNCCILDAAPVEIGSHAFIGPSCVLTTAGHALDSEQRGQGFELAQPIKLGDNVWLGANVTVLPGVTIGSDTIIGAGSVVNKDIPSGVIAFGNPCRVHRKITPMDRLKYPHWEEKDS